MTCPVENCKEIETVKHGLFGDNNIGGVYGTDGLKDKLTEKINEKADKGAHRPYLIASIGSIVVIIGIAIGMYANTQELIKDVPECKSQIAETVKDVATLKTDTQVLKTEKTQLQKDVDAINVKLINMDQKLDRIINMQQNRGN